VRHDTAGGNIPHQAQLALAVHHQSADAQDRQVSLLTAPLRR
jgi:hypothetical protein